MKALPFLRVHHLSLERNGVADALAILGQRWQCLFNCLSPLHRE